MSPALPKVAQPGRKTFDPWNSSSTGHQRAENRLSGSTSWRDSRSLKLANQFADPDQGGGRARLYDTVGAGSKVFGLDGRKENGDWEKGAPGLREPGWQDVGAMLQRHGTSPTKPGASLGERSMAGDKCDQSGKKALTVLKNRGIHGSEIQPAKKLFQGLNIYINGSSMPLISDHKLKHLLVQHGAGVSIALMRKDVTHVVVGRPNSRTATDDKSSKRGSGGGLSASKIQREITRVRGCGIKYVGVDWVLDSIQADKRLPEWKYDAGIRTAPCGVRGIASQWTKSVV